MNLNTDALSRCIQTLEAALGHLDTVPEGDVLYDIFRAACVKEFEIILEQSGRLLKKRLRPYFASDGQADQLAFKSIFRHAAKHSLITVEACERWLLYRDNRNDSAHEYGDAFAEAALNLMPEFLGDAKDLAAVIGEPFDA